MDSKYQLNVHKRPDLYEATNAKLELLPEDCQDAVVTAVESST